MDQNSSSGKKFDLNSEGGVGVVLASIRAGSISSDKKNELRDLVFSYTNSKGDINIKDQLQAKLSEYGVEPIQLASISKTQNTIFPFGSARPAPVFDTPAVTKKTPVVANEPKPVEDTPTPISPTETASQDPIEEPASTEPVKTPTEQKTISNDKTADDAKANEETAVDTPSDPVPVDVKSESVKVEESVPATSVPSSPLNTPDANKPSQEPTSTPNAPVTRPEPASDIPTSVPVSQDRLARIKEIKQAVNSKVGNPVNLIDIDNTVGREYMAALLDAMKKLNQGNALDMNTAMTRLEAAYKAVEVAVNKSKTASPLSSGPSGQPASVASPTTPAPASTPEPAPQDIPKDVASNPIPPTPTPTTVPASPTPQTPYANTANIPVQSQSDPVSPQSENIPLTKQATSPAPTSSHTNQTANEPLASVKEVVSAVVDNTPPPKTTTPPTQASNIPPASTPSPVSAPVNDVSVNGYANYTPKPDQATSGGDVPPSPDPIQNAPSSTIARPVIKSNAYTAPLSNAQSPAPTAPAPASPSPAPTPASAPTPNQPTATSPQRPVAPITPTSQPAVGGFANLAAIPNLADNTPTSPITAQSTPASLNPNQPNGINIPVQPHIDGSGSEKPSLVEKASNFASHLVENLGLNKHDNKKDATPANALPINQVPQTAPAPTPKLDQIRPLSGTAPSPQSQPQPTSTVIEPLSAAKAPLTPANLPETKELPENINDMSLYSQEIDYGLDQLLQEWILFNKSGLFGTGPKGREHPLFKQLAKLEMPIILTGRFEGATPEIKQSITDYMNGWRYEQGIIYEQNETFEDYLRRVIRHILDLQRNKRQA